MNSAACSYGDCRYCFVSVCDHTCHAYSEWSETSLVLIRGEVLLQDIVRRGFAWSGNRRYHLFYSAGFAIQSSRVVARYCDGTIPVLSPAELESLQVLDREVGSDMPWLAVPLTGDSDMYNWMMGFRAVKDAVLEFDADQQFPDRLQREYPS